MSEIPDDHAVSALKCASAVLELRDLLGDSRSACGRISDLIKAMRSYSYVDQDVTQEVDVHVGIDDTLTILGHKMPPGVEIVRDYQEELPKPTVYGSELNQVWTNLLDNAICAVKDEGTITIKTSNADEHIVVKITDDGPGIPKDIQSKIFDPFFTTKTVGEGTGLGLNITHRIVVSRHCGCIEVESKPGQTCFTVTLPITPPSVQKQPPKRPLLDCVTRTDLLPCFLDCAPHAFRRQRHIEMPHAIVFECIEYRIDDGRR